MQRRIRGPIGSLPWLRSLRRRVGLQTLLLLTLLLLTTLISGAVGNPNDLIASEEAAELAGYKRTVWGRGNDVVVEFYRNDSNYCGSFILVPGENIWAESLRGFLYLVALLYTFVGIAIVSDIFMAGIEKITSAKTKVKVMDDGTTHTFTVVVWNETVANLTLMALGSSAPEILMSVVETVSTMQNEKPGELGPSTIVGSAAFNLLVITALCIYTCEEGKKVKEVGVFMLTSIASMFAYIWLVITLMLWTPDEVTIVEGVLTLLFFPLLVILAWCQDRGWFREGPKTHVEQKVLSAEMDEGQIDRDRVQSLFRKMKEEKRSSGDSEGSDDEEELLERARRLERSSFTAGHNASHWSRAAYRMNAVRQLSKKHKLIEPRKSFVQKPEKHTPLDNEDTKDGLSPPREMRRTSTRIRRSSKYNMSTHGVLEWNSTTYSVIESEKKVKVTAVRYGNVSDTVTVRFRTKAGTALPGVKYEEREGLLVFEPTERRKDVVIPIVDDKQYQEDQYFYVILDHASAGAQLGEKTVTEVTIVDDDQPGQIELQSTQVTVTESSGAAKITLLRRNGCDGKVSVRLHTQDHTAKAGSDYEMVDVIVEFDHEECNKTVIVPIIDDTSYEKNETFRVVIQEPHGGATLGRIQACDVVIVNDDGVRRLIDQVVGELAQKKADIRMHMETSSWLQSFKEAVTLEEPEDDPLGFTDYLMHAITMFWKVIFATVPPTEMAGGWATFVVALIYIGVIVVVVGEVASLFGCVCGLPDSVTAITFVALGTSLPDLFASKMAAEEEEYADAAIGNVTGSNSVNVFLGLGLPWVIASAYKKAKDVPYTYPAGDLGFSVVVFLCTALICLAILGINRKVYGGELGGALRIPFAILLVTLWIAYIVLSSLKSTGKIDGF